MLDLVTSTWVSNVWKTNTTAMCKVGHTVDKLGCHPVHWTERGTKPTLTLHTFFLQSSEAKCFNTSILCLILWFSLLEPQTLLYVLSYMYSSRDYIAEVFWTHSWLHATKYQWLLICKVPSAPCMCISNQDWIGQKYVSMFQLYYKWYFVIMVCMFPGWQPPDTDGSCEYME
jgi:hypothetical protein